MKNHHGFIMEPLWNHHGTIMDPLWNRHGTIMEPSRFHHGTIMEIFGTVWVCKFDDIHAGTPSSIKLSKVP